MLQFRVSTLKKIKRYSWICITVILSFLLTVLLIMNRYVDINTRPSFTLTSSENLNKTDTAWKFRPRLTCDCRDVVYSTTTFEPALTSSNPWNRNSTCSPEATELGVNQNVISFSFYDGTHPRNYTKDIYENLLRMRTFYPGWLMRVYTDKSLDGDLCNLICTNQEDLFICPIKFADGFDLGEVSKEFQMQWRFLVLGDPTVERFLVRDLDSRLSQREVDAVGEWEKSGKIFHAMRDHPWHRIKIVGCCWGGNNLLLGNASRQIQKDVVMNRDDIGINIDQTALALYVYPFKDNNSILIHDSYLCKKMRDSQPFPTQRVNLEEFVGKPTQPDVKYKKPWGNVSECPIGCRPSFGQDWLWC